MIKVSSSLANYSERTFSLRESLTSVKGKDLSETCSSLTDFGDSMPPFHVQTLSDKKNFVSQAPVSKSALKFDFFLFPFCINFQH